MAQKDDSRSSPPQSSNGLLKVILLGHLVVSLPALVLIFGFFIVGKQLFAGKYSLYIFTAGFILAWLWWAFMTPRWRRWASQSAIPVDKLQLWATATGLTWPKGWVFEKTEIKGKEAGKTNRPKN